MKSLLMISLVFISGCLFDSLTTSFDLGSFFPEEERTFKVEEPLEELNDYYPLFNFLIEDLRIDYIDIEGIDFYYTVRAEGSNTSSKIILSIYFSEPARNVFEGEPIVEFPLELKAEESTSASGQVALNQRQIDLIKSGTFQIGLGALFGEVATPPDSIFRTTIIFDQLVIKVKS